MSIIDKVKIGQAVLDNERVLVVGENDTYFIAKSSNVKTTLDLINMYDDKMLMGKLKSFKEDAQVIRQGMDVASLEKLSLKWLPCIDAPEVWAVGVTYKRQAKEHDDDIKKTTSKVEELYSFVYENPRAEVFFKGFNRTIRAHDEDLCLRGDSELTLPEAESVLVLGDEGSILGFTYGNDLTAWDIEKECPLYLNQAKIWDGSAGVGQYLIPLECIEDPYDFTLRCTVERGGEVVVDSSGSTKDLKRSYEELIYFLRFYNSIPMGTLLFTGTSCIIPHDFSLIDGDIVMIEKVGYGSMKNKIKKLLTPPKNYRS